MIDQFTYLIFEKILNFLEDKDIFNLKRTNKKLNLLLKNYKLKNSYKFDELFLLFITSLKLYQEPYQIFQIQHIKDYFKHIEIDNPELLSLLKNCNSLKSIKFTITKKNKNILLHLPNNLKEISLNYNDFNDFSIKNELQYLPKSLTYFELWLNTPLESLPDCLQEIHLGYQFNQPINNLPNNLKTLTFSGRSKFNFNVDNLPPKLEYLDFGDDSYFDQSLDHLPSSLKFLNTAGLFNQNINNLPSNLVELQLGHNFNQPIDYLPKSLKKLCISGYDSDYGVFNQSIDQLPNNLKQLIIESENFNQPIDNLPKNLEVLTIYSEFFDQSLDLLPNSLIKLRLSGDPFDQPINKLPIDLKLLDITSKLFNQSIDQLPKGLKKLYIRSDCFNQSINQTYKYNICYIESKTINMFYSS